MNKDTNQVEDIFKEAFENYEVDAGSNTWQAIQAKMAAESAAAASASAASSTTAASSTSWMATAIVATIISATAIGGYFFFNDTAEKIKSKEQQIESKKKVEQPESVNNQTENRSKKALVNNDKIQPEASTKSDQNSLSNKQTQTTQIDQNSRQKTESTTITQNKVSSASTESNSKSPSERNTQSNESAGETKSQHAESTNEQTNNQSATSTQEAESVDQLAEEPAVETNDKKSNSNSSTPVSSNDFEKENKVEAPDFGSIPNVFTPNQDGKNDEFEIIGIEDLDKFHIQIFNKSGQKVFESFDINDRWQGDLPNGSSAPNGLYFYQIVVEKVGKAFPKTGSVSLTR